MGKDKASNDINEHEGSNRMLRSLGVNHRNEYEQVGKEIGLSYGVLDSVSLAAWAEDARLKDWQIIRSIKHLRHGLGGKVAESFIHTIFFQRLCGTEGEKV